MRPQMQAALVGVFTTPGRQGFRLMSSLADANFNVESCRSRSWLDVYIKRNMAGPPDGQRRPRSVAFFAQIRPPPANKDVPLIRDDAASPRTSTFPFQMRCDPCHQQEGCRARVVRTFSPSRNSKLPHERIQTCPTVWCPLTLAAVLRASYESWRYRVPGWIASIPTSVVFSTRQSALARSLFRVLLALDPHLYGCRKASQRTTTDPRARLWNQADLYLPDVTALEEA